MMDLAARIIGTFLNASLGTVQTLRCLSNTVARTLLRRTTLAPAYRRSENIGIEPIVVAELKFSDVERHIFGGHFVEGADNAALGKSRPSNLTQKSSASRWALRQAPVRSLRRSRLAGRDRPARGPAESPDRLSAVPAAGLGVVPRRERSVAAAGRCRAARAPRGRPWSWPG